jgi:hypothetical protein
MKLAIEAIATFGIREVAPEFQSRGSTSNLSLFEFFGNLIVLKPERKSFYLR